MTASSLKDMTSRGAIPTIRRQFTVAAGETIDKGDVVSVYNNQVYKNSSAPLSALTKFSPDVLYLPSLVNVREIVMISDTLFLTLSTGIMELIVGVYEITPGGIVEKSKKTISTYDEAGYSFYYLKKTSSSNALVIFKQASSTPILAVAVNFSNPANLKTGQWLTIADGTLLTESKVKVEPVSDTSFLVTWVRSETARARICTLSGTDNLVITAGQEYNVADTNLTQNLSLCKLDSSRFSIAYTTTGAGGTFLKTKVISLSGTTITYNSTDTQAYNTNVINSTDQIKMLAISDSKYAIINFTSSGHNYALLSAAGLNTSVDMTDWIPIAGFTAKDSCDLVRVSDSRILVAAQVSNSTTTNGYLMLLDTSSNRFLPVGPALVIPANLNTPNKMRILPLGNDLYTITFNYKGNDTFKYAQALLVRANATMTALDSVSTKEQLININERAETVYAFCFAAVGTTGKFISGFMNRLKIFSCGWSPVKFITSPTGEFQDISNSVDVIGNRQKAALLPNGDVAIVYRERDTRHGKCSVFRPSGGGYNLLYTHTFSNSHVDNLDIISLGTNRIAFQYKYRTNPSYDQSQNNHGSIYEENNLQVAEVTDTGLVMKASRVITNDPFQISYVLPINVAIGQFLFVGQTSNKKIYTQIYTYWLSQGNPTLTSYNAYQFPNETADLKGVTRLGPDLFVLIKSTGYTIFRANPSNIVKLVDDPLAPTVGTELLGLLQWEENEAYFFSKSDTTSGILNLTSYSATEEMLYQTGTVQRRSGIIPSKVYSVARMGNRLAVMYKAANQTASEPGRPNRDTFLALLTPNRWNRSVKDLFTPLPSGASMSPVFLPISENRAFVICVDENLNQIVTTAYVDDHCISLGRPNLTPTGVASETGTAGQEIGVIQNGIVDYYTGLTVGATYFTDLNGKISMTVGTRKVGTAISDKELLISRLM